MDEYIAGITSCSTRRQSFYHANKICILEGLCQYHESDAAGEVYRDDGPVRRHKGICNNVQMIVNYVQRQFRLVMMMEHHLDQAGGRCL